MRTEADQVAGSKRALSGIRQGMVGLILVLLSYGLWAARDAIPNLATTRVVATASCTAWHDATEAQLLRAFATARTRVPAAETAFERDPKPDRYGVTYYLYVTADTDDRAQADLAALADALKAAFPSAERNLMVSMNKSTVPAPNDASRKIALGVRAAVVLMVLGAELLIVVGAYREGVGRTGIFASLATPFTFLIFPTTSSRHPSTSGDQAYIADWHFLVLMLGLTVIAAILGLWLTRKPRAAGEPRRRR